MPTGTVMMPLTLGRGICGINACNDASTWMLNISPQFYCLVQSLQTAPYSHSHLVALIRSRYRQITPCEEKHVN